LQWCSDDKPRCGGGPARHPPMAGSWGSPASPLPARGVGGGGGGRSPAGPSSRDARELGGQPGRLLGSSVGDHRDRRVGHGNHPFTAWDGRYLPRGPRSSRVGGSGKGPCPSAKPTNQRTRPVQLSLSAAFRGLPWRVTASTPKHPWTQLRTRLAADVRDRPWPTTCWVPPGTSWVSRTTGGPSDLLIG
jgi:hypothetical protein